MYGEVVSSLSLEIFNRRLDAHWPEGFRGEVKLCRRATKYCDSDSSWDETHTGAFGVSCVDKWPPVSVTHKSQNPSPVWSTLPAHESLTLRMTIVQTFLPGERVGGRGRKKAGVPHRLYPQRRAWRMGASQEGSVPFLVERQHGRAQDVVRDDGTHHHGCTQTKSSSLSPPLGHHQLLPHVNQGQRSFLGPQRHVDVRSAQVTSHPQKGRQVRRAWQLQRAFLVPCKPPPSSDRQVLSYPFYR